MKKTVESAREFNILIVDDLVINLQVLHDTLEKSDRQIFLAKSGNEAFKIIADHSIDLVLLDIQMPNIDGFQVAELLKSNKKTKEIPIIFVTAIHRDKSSMIKGLKTGAIDYLYKPLDIDITQAKVDSVLKLIGQKNELRLRNEELERYAVLLNNANQAMCILDANLHGIEAVNNNFEQQFEMLFAEIKGNYFFDYFKTDDIQSQAALFSEGMDKRKTEYRFNCCFKRKDGEIEVKWKFIEHKGKWHGLVQDCKNHYSTVLSCF